MPAGMTTGSSKNSRRIAVTLLALVLCLGVAACGDDEGADTATTEETTTTDETTETTTAAGREVFVANCGSCHTLSDAGTSGAIGPSLDGIGLDVSAIESQVRNGGGGMPAFEGQLSDEEIQAVSAYVAESS
jgi:mono/diheme cytochrome c family protein